LRTAGISADVEITKYVPGRTGISFNQPEAVAFYIAGAMSSSVLSANANDLYQHAKTSASARFSKKVRENPNGLHRPEEFTIYGPDGEVLKKWSVDDQGEHED